MRTTLAGTARWLVAVLAMALLPLGQLVGAATAHANAPGAPGAPGAPADTGSVCFLGLDGSPTGCAPTKLPSPGLISPHFLGSDQTRAAMHRLENRAVELTLADHGLPASDSEAVKSWARSDAQAELWALIVEAIKTPPGQRTADQQAAVTWIASMDRSLKAWAGRNAGLEYTKWAGLSTKRYWELVNGGAGVNELTDFLHSSTQPYEPGDKASGGYCRYKPPAPYQDEYSASTAQTCYTPCPNPFGCYVPTPTVDQFARWGATTASAATAGSVEYLKASAGISSAGAFGVVAGAAGVTGLATYSLGMLGLLGELPAILVGLEGGSGTILLTVSETASVNVLNYLVGDAAIAAGSAALAASVAVVIAAIAIAVIEATRVFGNDALPEKVAHLVVDSRGTVDPASLVETQDGASALFHAFVYTLLPPPADDAACQERPALWQYRAGAVQNLDEGSFLYLSANDGRLVEHDGYQCLNPTPLPQPRDTDPQFLVEPRVRQVGDPGQPVRAGAITMASQAMGLTTRVRLSDAWFVKHAVIDRPSAHLSWDAQSLSLDYTDWDGVAQQAWLIRDESGQYEFVGHRLGAQGSGDSHWHSRYVEYVGPDGRGYRASVDGYHSPVGTPSYSPSAPVEGAPVVFDGNGFRPGGTSPVGKHSWRFQDDSCGQPCLTVGSEGTGWQPSYGPPVVADEATHTWQAPGTYAVQLTATDQAGEEATTTFAVQVGGVAPRLEVATACPLLPHEGRPCNQDQVVTGSAVSLTGTVTHTGAHDRERIVVDWGDGTRRESAEAGPGAALQIDGNPVEAHVVGDTQVGWEAHHTYADPGRRLVTVVVTDAAGQSDTRTFIEQVRGPQRIAFSAPTRGTFGDRVPLQATGGDSGRPVTFTATPGAVCTVEASDLQLVGVGACTVTAHQDGGVALYESAAPVEQVVTVMPAPLRVVVDPVSRVYGTPPPHYTVRAVGLRNGDTLEGLAGLVVTGAPQTAHVGSYEVVPSGITDANYDVTYAPALEKVTAAMLVVTPVDVTRVVGDPLPAYSARFDGLVNGDRPADIAGLRFHGAAADSPVGVYRINVTGAASHDYVYRYRTGTETIVPPG